MTSELPVIEFAGEAWDTWVNLVERCHGYGVDITIIDGSVTQGFLYDVDQTREEDYLRYTLEDFPPGVGLPTDAVLFEMPVDIVRVIKVW